MSFDPSSVPSNKEIEALTLLERADKKANAFTFFGLTGSKQSQLEEAADLCARSGNLYKTEKKWKEAGDAYLKSVNYLLRINDRDEAANKLVEASKCYKKTDPEEAIRALIQAVEMMKEAGRFHSAAGYQKQIAEVYESDQIDIGKSLHHYEEAAELYSGEESGGLANQCWVKVALFAAQLEQYDKAIEKFEHVATTSLENNLTKFGAKQYMLQAGMCHLCVDIVTARRALQRYQDMDASFAQSREGQFLQNLVEAVEAGDAGVFTRHVSDFDRMTKLDSWKTTILLRIKKQIAEEPSLT